MAKKIYKYPLETTDLQELALPLNSKILSVGKQGHDLMLWAWVDPDPAVKKEIRKIAIIGTGNPIPKTDTDDQAYNLLGRVDDVPFVWHVFEVIVHPMVTSANVSGK